MDGMMGSEYDLKGRDISTNVPSLDSRYSSTHGYNSFSGLRDQLNQHSQFTLEDILAAFSPSSFPRESRVVRTSTIAMSSSRSGRSGGSSSHSSSKSSKKPRAVQVSHGLCFVLHP
ncbi:hypothetical protein LX36DRAFT_87689 [Colletotrichum falcatum]|nr:hypothetical protein LX36DRAFT_87689 [Colletotrichum falcatum]